MLYRITASVQKKIHNEHSEWECTIDIPTFYLDSDSHPNLSEFKASQIARNIIGVGGKLESIDVSVTAIEPIQGE